MAHALALSRLVIDEEQIQDLDAQQLRQVVRTLIADVAGKDAQIAFKQAFIDKLTHEMAVLKRLKFAAQSEAFNAEQKSLLDETIDTDLAALAAEIEQAEPQPPGQDDKQKPKRQPLPQNLPRRELHHEPENTTCGCGCQLKGIGRDVAEKLDYHSPACSLWSGTSAASGSAPSAKP
jgi:transposase